MDFIVIKIYKAEVQNRTEHQTPSMNKIHIGIEPIVSDASLALSLQPINKSQNGLWK